MKSLNFSHSIFIILLTTTAVASDLRVTRDTDKFSGASSCSISWESSSISLSSYRGISSDCTTMTLLMSSPALRSDNIELIALAQTYSFACKQVLKFQDTSPLTGYWAYGGLSGKTIDPRMIYSVNPSSENLSPAPTTLLLKDVIRGWASSVDDDALEVRLGERGARVIRIEKSVGKKLLSECDS